jgi:dihydrofolate reductase
MAAAVLYIASSLDGYIALPDGGLDWLMSFPPPPDGGDYGYGALLAQTGGILMGRKTYEEVLGFGGEWPYAGTPAYVATRQESYRVQTPDTEVLSGDLKAFVEGWRGSSPKNLWLVGGGELVARFLQEGLIDRIILTVIPKTLGQGIRLFLPQPAAGDWALRQTEAFPNGAVQLTYDFAGI